jgi:hypothetical protein
MNGKKILAGVVIFSAGIFGMTGLAAVDEKTDFVRKSQTHSDTYFAGRLKSMRDEEERLYSDARIIKLFNRYYAEADYAYPPASAVGKTYYGRSHAGRVFEWTEDAVLLETGPGTIVKIPLKELSARLGTRQSAVGDWLYKDHYALEPDAVHGEVWKKIQNPTVELEG